MKNDPLYRLERNLRKRFAIAIKKNYKTGSAVRDLGCTIEEFKTHIESKKWHTDKQIDYILLGMDPDEIIAQEE